MVWPKKNSTLLSCTMCHKHRLNLRTLPGEQKLRLLQSKTRASFYHAKYFVLLQNNTFHFHLCTHNFVSHLWECFGSTVRIRLAEVDASALRSQCVPDFIVKYTEGMIWIRASYAKQTMYPCFWGHISLGMRTFSCPYEFAPGLFHRFVILKPNRNVMMANMNKIARPNTRLHSENYVY